MKSSENKDCLQLERKRRKEHGKWMKMVQLIKEINPPSDDWIDSIIQIWERKKRG